MSAPAVAVARDGLKMVFAWKDVRTREPNVYWTFCEGRRTGVESVIHASVRGPQDHPSLALDAGGVVWAAWEDGRTGTPQIRARSSSAPAEHAVSGDDGIVGFPSLAVRDGLVAVAYESEYRGADRVLVRVLARGR